ncbi:hypothetical protein PQU92_05440 [Asticcacaulis sp. BYS171W]|uniref:Uncharacterized protein n=1 Tax=Asticcacaulis aquaticus TaxID=2984212 RepID=A0ABT5HRM3_9CAUL|nr:hypothetical protein [Asticcacaulis aquaticus]MDC7682709.1 hypothetical protein [Asticcacaulis aquaticus]
MDYREPKRLSFWLKGMTLSGLGVSLTGGLLISLSVLIDPNLQGLNDVNVLLLLGVLLSAVNLPLNVAAQLFWIFWLRRLSLNAGLSGATAVAAYLIPIGTLWGPFRVIKRVSTRIGEVTDLRPWWTVTVLAGLPILPFTIWLAGEGLDRAGLSTPSIVVMLFGYMSVITGARDYTGWQLVKRFSAADHRAKQTEVAVNAF